jgi:hypothetical protein
MPATVVYREEDEKSDESRYKMVAWQVPVTEDFPQGLKYSFQYMDAAATRPVIRQLAVPPRRHPASSTPTRWRNYKTGVYKPCRPDQRLLE